MSGIFCGPDPSDARWKQFLLRSRGGGKTRDKPICLPADWGSEGAITRAKDGGLLVALRMGQAPGYPKYNDHWRRIRTARWTDGGKTWTDMQVYFKYGKVRSDLLTRPNGDIVNTYATRIGKLDGRVYHGIEAVVSHDHGKMWELAQFGITCSARPCVRALVRRADSHGVSSSLASLLGEPARSASMYRRAMAALAPRGLAATHDEPVPSCRHALKQFLKGP